MIVFKDVPGLTYRETLQELIAISNDQAATGYGGVVVDEETAYEFLRAYLTILGKIKDEWKPDPEVTQEIQEEHEVPQEEPPEAAQETQEEHVVSQEAYVKPRTTRGRKSY